MVRDGAVISTSTRIYGRAWHGYDTVDIVRRRPTPEEVISRSWKWKWPVSSKRLLLGPGCLGTKMFSIAQLIKVHLDLWPWLTFWGHFKVTNVKIAYIFFMVRDKHMLTMKHYWEVDIELSESANKFDLGWPWRGYFKVKKVKVACIV